MFDHVLFISLDTLRTDCIAYNPHKLWPEKYGLQKSLKPSVLDEIAAEGAFFTNCITAAPYTAASHATYFTGKWPLRHGLYEFFNRALRSSTIFSAAQRAGFATTFKVDFPIILGSFLGFDLGVERYIVEDDDAFIEAISLNRQNLAFAHFGSLHVPYGFHNLRYGGGGYVETVRRLEAEIPTSASKPTDSLVETYRDAEDLAMMIRYKRIVQYHYERQNYAKLFELYLDGVNLFLATRFDRFFRRLQKVLAGTNYLLVIFGDHGEEWDADSYGHHNSLAEGVLRVPVIFYGPGVSSGLYPRRIRSIDVVPTVLELLSRSAPSWLRCDGRSLAETVTGRSDYDAGPAFAQTYTAEASEYVAYQKRLLTKGIKTGSLRHVLYKEAVYLNNLKLTRQHHHYTEGGGIWGLTQCVPKISVEEIDEHGICRPYRGQNSVQDLTAQLDLYNTIQKPRNKSQVVPQHVRAELQKMGYQL